MTERLPSLKPREVIGALEKAGWYVHRQKGGHLIMHNVGSANIIVIPMHTRDLPKGTLRGIVEDAGLTVAGFIELLRQ